MAVEAKSESLVSLVGLQSCPLVVLDLDRKLLHVDIQRQLPLYVRSASEWVEIWIRERLASSRPCRIGSHGRTDSIRVSRFDMACCSRLASCSSCSSLHTIVASPAQQNFVTSRDSSITQSQTTSA